MNPAVSLLQLATTARLRRARPPQYMLLLSSLSSRHLHSRSNPVLSHQESTRLGSQKLRRMHLTLSPCEYGEEAARSASEPVPPGARAPRRRRARDQGVVLLLLRRRRLLLLRPRPRAPGDHHCRARRHACDAAGRGGPPRRLRPLDARRPPRPRRHVRLVRARVARGEAGRGGRAGGARRGDNAMVAASARVCRRAEKELHRLAWLDGRQGGQCGGGGGRGRGGGIGGRLLGVRCHGYYVVAARGGWLSHGRRPRTSGWRGWALRRRQGKLRQGWRRPYWRG